MMEETRLEAKLAELISLKPVIIGGEKQYLYNDLQTNKTIPLSEEYVVTTFGKTKESLDKMLDNTHLRGGNYFITKNKSGEDEVLIGADELKKFNHEQIQQMLKVDKIHVIPQMDKDLDMFIRPLNNGKVLIADDNMTKNAMAEGLIKIKETAQKCVARNDYASYERLHRPYNMLSMMLDAFDNVAAANKFAKTDETAKALEKAGYEVIRVPGRLYSVSQKNPDKLTTLYNFMNANVLLNNDNELVYITNDSIFDRATLGITKDIENMTGFSMKKSFFNELGKYVNLEHAYTIAGDNNAITETLLNDGKGIHSMCAEVLEQK